MPGVPYLAPTPPALLPNVLQLAESHLQPLQKEDSFLICCFSKSFFPTDRNFKGTLLHPFPLAEFGALWSVFAAELWVVVFGWKQKLGQEEHRSSCKAARLPLFFQGPPPFTN